MRFGLALPHYDDSLAGHRVSWEGVKSAVLRAESAGFDSVWVSDHFFLDWGRYGGSADTKAALECWTTMAAVAACTERVRIGSLALCNDFRNPALVAKMAASLDVLSNGRVDVGLGAGWYEPEYRAAGLEFSAPGDRIRRLGESLQIVGRLLAGEELFFDGEHYSMAGAVCRPAPVQKPRPPLWAGGKGDFLVKTAARHADGWNFSWIGSPAVYSERSRAADDACEQIGREPTSLRRSAGVYLLAGRDQSDARRRFERLVERTPRGVLRDLGGRGEVSWDEFQENHVAGSTGEVVEYLGRLADLGVEEVVISLGTLPFQVADVEDIEFVGAEVAPALR